MAQPLPDPIPVPWTMKPLASAQTSLDILDDGRLRASITHDVLHGVTPEMLVWWFQNVEGDMDVEGKRWPRYRVWHPRDHVALRYVRRAPGGGIGVGAIFHIHELLGRNPAHVVNIKTLIRRLDAGGFAHGPRAKPARMDYTFTRVPGGTRYENSLTVGVAGGPLARLINAQLRRHVFPEPKARAWLLHNVEEVGNFEFFLPDLMRAAT
jgi:hypothetical protein